MLHSKLVLQDSIFEFFEKAEAQFPEVKFKMLKNEKKKVKNIFSLKINFVMLISLFGIPLNIC